MANPVRGTCKCPLCADDGAEVREGVKGRLYIVCDSCVSMTTTMSRQGRTLIAGRIGDEPAPNPAPNKVGADATATAAAPAPTPKPAAKPAPAQKPATLGFFGL